MGGENLDLGKYGPWALIVGGSDGVGEAFAHKLAAQGFKLIIAARRPGPLNALAEELRGQGAEVRTLSVDMTEPAALQKVQAATSDIEVGLLIYNAGVVGGPDDFIKQDPEQFRGYIDLNVLRPAELSHHFGGLMCSRGRGGIILVGSTGSFMGSPGLAIYCGVKAFSRIFSEGFWFESQKYGVDVLHLVLGFTATPTIERLGLDTSFAQAPDAAAQEGLDNLAHGPIWIANAEANLDGVVARSQVSNRAEAVRASVIPTGAGPKDG
jgi:short-subunit dehydrogenase